MKTKLLLFLLFATGAFAQQTPNIHLNVPATHTVGWDTLLNSNWQSLDAFLSGNSTIPAIKTSQIILLGNANIAGGLVVGGVVNIPLLGASSNVCTDPTQNLTTIGCAQGGTVTSVGGFAPLFTVINPTTNASFTATPFAAHTFYGNNTNTTANPGALTIGTGDLPFTYSGNTTLLGTIGTFTGGTGALICKDASGNLTTTGCSTAGGGAIVGSPGAGVNQTVTQATGTDLNVNRMEDIRFCDQFGSLQACHDDLPSNGGIMILPRGTTNVCGLNITKDNVHMIGTGKESTTLACATASSPVVSITGDQPLLENMTVKHITNQPTCPGGDGTATCGDGIQWAGGAGTDAPTFRHIKTNFNYNGFALGPVSKGIITDVVSDRNQNHGFTYIFSAARPVMQWTHTLTYSLQNLNDGFHLQNTTGVQQTCPQWISATAFGNGQYGWNVTATAPNGIAVCFWSGIVASTNNNSGIRLDSGSGGRTHVISGFCFLELSGELNNNAVGGGSGFQIGWNTTPVFSSTGDGLEITANNDTSNPNIKVSDCATNNNAWSGISSLTAQVTMMGNNSFNNGRAGAGIGKRSGVAVGADRNVVVGGVHVDGAGTEAAGVEVFNNADLPSISDYQCSSSISTCTLISTVPASGTVNKMGGISWFTKAGVASGACTNGNMWTNTTAGNVTPVLSVCKNSAWVTVQ